MEAARSDPGSVLRVIVGIRRHPDVDPEEQIPDSNLERIFRRIDSMDGNYDGKIESSRLVEILAVLDKRRGSAEFRKAKRAVLGADSDKDGKLDRKEFYRLMCDLRCNFEEGSGGKNGSDVEAAGGCEEDGKNWLEKYMEVAANAEQYRWFPPPWFVLSATLFQVAFFVFHVFHFLAKEEASIATTWTGPYQYCSALIFNPRRRHEVWRYGTYAMVHAGAQHLLVNVFLQLLVGLPLEMSNGSVRVAAVYFAGVYGASLGVSSFRPLKYLAGASGAVFALVGGHCASMILNWKEDKLVTRQRLRTAYKYSLTGGSVDSSTTALKKMRKAKKLRLVRLAFVLLLSGLDIGMSFSETCHNSGDCTTVEAHSCGMAGGLLAGIVVLRNRKLEEWERSARAVAGVMLVCLLAAAVAWAVVGDDVYAATTPAGSRRTTWFLPEEYSLENKTCSYTSQFG